MNSENARLKTACHSLGRSCVGVDGAAPRGRRRRRRCSATVDKREPPEPRLALALAPAPQQQPGGRADAAGDDEPGSERGRRRGREVRAQLAGDVGRVAEAGAELLDRVRELLSLGVGIGLLVTAAVFGLFVLGFGLAAAAAGIATVLPAWAALLIVTGGLVGLAALLGLLGIARLRKGAPPVPEQAIAEARKTAEALRSDGGD